MKISACRMLRFPYNFSKWFFFYTFEGGSNMYHATKTVNSSQGLGRAQLGLKFPALLQRRETSIATLVNDYLIPLRLQSAS